MSSNIQYSPDLIEGFERDHKKLLQSFGQLVKTANKSDYPAFQVELARFKSMLVAHLLKEAVKLYIYLRQQFKQDAAIHGLVTSYKLEMDGIGRVAMGVIDKYLVTPVEEVDFAALSATLNEIGGVLTDRIRREESELYPLYSATY